MSYEYVRFNRPEAVYGKKNLLQLQINLLNTTKIIRRYHSIRSDELLLKVALKSKLDELKGSLNMLDKLIPKGTIVPEKNIAKPEDELFEKRNLSLEEEIANIKSKLARIR